MSTLETSDGLALHTHRWPVPEPRLTLAILHGYAEHAGRYAHVAAALNAAGIAAVAVDLRGHGRSPGVRGYVERFSDYHRDVDALLGLARAESGGRPVALFGHSMGGLLAAHYLLQRGSSGLSGLVLSSPYLGLALQVNPVKLAAGRLMSRLHPQLALASGLKGSDVTRDPAMQRRYEEDPLNGKTATARWFTEATLAMEEVHAQAGRLQLPTLLLYGGADRVASADATDRFAAALAMRDKTAERLAGFHHELVNEPLEERTQVIERISRWLTERSAAKAS
jgi:acylglycerol lipase